LYVFLLMDFPLGSLRKHILPSFHVSGLSHLFIPYIILIRTLQHFNFAYKLRSQERLSR